MASKSAGSVLGLFVLLAPTLQYFVAGTSPLFVFNSTKSYAITPNENNVHQVDLKSSQLVYESKDYSRFFISKDGYVAFAADATKVNYHAVDWSASNVSPFIDIPFIAPFYHHGGDIDSIKDYQGRVTYQEVRKGTTSSYQDDLDQQEELDSMGSYIQSQVIGSGPFEPTWMMQITWENVTSTKLIDEDDTCLGNDYFPCAANTFQLVLITDGTASYAIFNYEAMNIPAAKFDQAGFNGGASTGWVSLLSESAATNRLGSALRSHQASDTRGRYVYRISAGRVLRGGCTTDMTSTQLSIFPNYAGMFGGRMIEISGPCFSSTDQIVCRFGDQPAPQSQPLGATPRELPTSPATFVRPTLARCYVPRLLVRDRITLAVSTDGGMNFRYSTTLTIVYPGRMPGEEHVKPKYTSTDLTWYDHVPKQQLTLEWNSALLSNTSAGRVDINLIGYRENDGVASYKVLRQLATNVQVTAQRQSHTINPADHACAGQDCFAYEIGLLEVKLLDGPGVVPQTYKFLSSTVIPLAWYVRDAMISEHGADWSSRMCLNWHNKDKGYTDWLQGLLSCPCTLPQAIADFGRWQPDTSCNQEQKDNPANCFYHKEAEHCVRAVQPVKGAGNQCCYGSKGELIFAADSFQGSTPDRGHTWGAAPYGRAGFVPSMSHWLDDVVSFYYCCLWTGYNSCDYYMDLRPTRDCTGYVSPLTASVYGQGHIRTFAGTMYRMLGPGDYDLVMIGDTKIQGRFERNPFKTDTGKQIESTYTLTGVAIRSSTSSDIVELNLRGPQFSHENQHIDVRVNGKFVAFNDKAMAWQDFKGVSVINTDRERDVQSNFTVLLADGVGLQIAESAHTLQLDVMVPGEMAEENRNKALSDDDKNDDDDDKINKVKCYLLMEDVACGLFGGLDGYVLSKNGTFFDVADKYSLNDRKNIYNNLQLSWAVQNESTCLFKNFFPANHTFSGEVNLNPTAIPFIDTRGIASVCNGVSECMFDFRYTGSREIASSTATAAKRYMSLRTNLEPVRSCGLLNVPHATKDNYNYVIGTKTVLTGCRSGALSGSTAYECIEVTNDTQRWSPDITATCEVATEDADVGLIVGVVVAIVVVLAIAIVVAIFAVRRQKKKNWKRSGTAERPEETHAMKTSV